ncbi:MAG: restriction endonuclease subunit S [Candidatus Portnoybacteria bacterium]|nr:restriction endonuclease subunit S [Candidatus Portnoybacteria bacterium]MDD4983004.1 restriction endonuclease subunit S [Candidatus Portnoybacteria bacterium]
MSTNWQTKKLGEVCDIFNGNSINAKIKKEKYYGLKIGNSFIATKDVGFNNGINYENGVKIPKDEIKFKISKKNSVLICAEGGSAGRKIGFTENDVCFGNKLFSINSEKQDNKFIYYFCFTDYFQKEFRKSLTGIIGGVSLKKFKNIQIPLPPLPKQQRIVKILDEVFADVAKAKENAERNLQNAKGLFESYLRSIFVNLGKNWDEKKLSEVCEKITDGTHQTPKYFDNGFIFLSSRNVRSGRIDWNKIKYIDKKQHLEMHKRVVPKINDILLAKNGTTGVAAMVDKDVDFDIYVSLALLRAKEMIEPNFLLYFVNSPVAKKQFDKRLKGSGVPNLHLEEIREVVIPFPKSIKEQKSIVAKLDVLSVETKKLEAIYKQKLTDLEELKKSVLKKAFAGELVQEKNTVPVAQMVAPSPFIRNQVHAAIIDQVTKNSGSTTEVAVAKYDHLLQEIFGLNLGYQFQTQQFGPFDAQIKRLIYSGLGPNKWFTKRSGMIVFGNNINTLLLRQSNLYRAAQSAMKELTKLGITKLDADKVELLSTICHSIKETKSIVSDKVREFMSQWPADGNRTKADKFSSEQTQKCLDFIVKNNWHLKLL